MPVLPAGSRLALLRDRFGNELSRREKWDATSAPTTGDDSADGYRLGSLWVDVTNDKVYVAVDVSVGAAVWLEAGGGTALTAHTGDTSDAHDASAVSFDDTGLGITASDVQAMGEQLDAAISAGGIPATIFDAKGDIIAAAAADTAARLAVAANGYTLMTASGETTGLKWSPRGLELSRVEFTADVTVSATTEAGATTVVTAGAITFDGSTIVDIEFFAPSANPPAVAGQAVTFCLYDGASSIGFFGQIITPAAAVTRAPAHLTRRLTPSAAAHTYSVRAFATSASGTVKAGAGGAAAFVPGFIRIVTV